MRTSVFQILGDALGLAVRRPVVFVPFLVPVALMALLGGLTLGSADGEVGALGALGVVLVLATFVAGMWAFPAAIAMVERIERGESVAFGPAAREGLRRLLPFLGLTIVLGVIFLVALGLPGLLLSFVGLGAVLGSFLSSFLGPILGVGTGPASGFPDLSGLTEVSGQAAAGLGAAAVVGLIVLGIWGLFLWVKLSLAVPALALGEAGPLGAIGEGWRRSRGAFWPLLGLVLLVGIVPSGIGFVLGLLPTVGSVLQGVLLFAAYVVGTVAFTLAYLHLRAATA